MVSQRTTSRKPGLETIADNMDEVIDATDVSVDYDLVPMDTSLFKASTPGTDANLETYFRRPISIASGLLTNTDAGATNLGNAFVTVLTKNTMLMRKLEGAFGFRGTFCLELRVNAQKFQQGRYMIGIVPHGGSCSDGYAITDTAYFKMHAGHVVPCSQLPHVEIDLARQTSATLKYPYVNQYLLFPQAYQTTAGSGTRNAGEIGYIFLRPYVALSAITGALSCPYSLWAWFEDVVVEGIAVPQGDDLEDPSPEGPIAKVAKKVTRSSVIWKDVPFLGSFAKTLGWVSDNVARTCNVWGWSRPFGGQPPKRIRHGFDPFHSCGEGVWLGDSLAVTPGNSVQVLPGAAGIAEDELAINSFKKRFAHITTISWSTSDTAGSILSGARVSVNPGACYTTFTDSGATVLAYTPIGFLANMFSLYRGGLALRIKVVSTTFHSGRFMVAVDWDPTGIDKTTTYDVGEHFMLRRIIDVRESSEVDITIPWQSNTSWLACSESNMSVYFFCVDPLVAPATVSNTISLIVEVAGADDMEFAVPCRLGYLSPYVPFTPQGSDLILGEGNIATSKLSSDGISECMYCIGEKIMSLRTMIKRFQYWGTTASTTACYVSPFNIAYAYGDGTVVKEANYAPTFVHLLMSMFALSRGSWRVRVSNMAGGEVTTVLEMGWTGSLKTSGITTANTTAAAVLGANRNCASTMLKYADSDIAADVHLPFYNFNHSVAQRGMLSSVYDSRGPTPTYQQAPIGRVVVVGTNTAARTVFIAAGDDFNMQGFVSIPLMVTTTPTNI